MRTFLDPFASLAPPRPACRATVVIPAQNEADRIERTLLALIGQHDVSGTPLDPDVFDVLVYANNCRDATAERARRFAGAHPAHAIFVAEEHLPPNVAHIGTARRAAMNAAGARLSAAGVTDGVLLATDADTIVAPAWIAWTLREMQNVDVVTGRILVEPAEWARLPVRVRRFLAAEDAYLTAVSQLESLIAPRAWDPWPRNWQRSGPSFAVRVDAYERAGGVPPVRTLEDIALYDALVATGARIRHSLRVRVWTSGRFDSRAPGGFGERIGAWMNRSGSGDEQLLVEHPWTTIDRLSRIDDAGRQRPHMPIGEATALIRQLIARGTTDARATRSNVASMAG